MSRVDRGKYAKKCQCPKCAENGGDTAKDNLHYYGEGKGSYCHVCSYTEPSDEWLAAHANDSDWLNEEEVVSKEKVTKEQVEKIKGYTGVEGHRLRGISDETYKAYAVRHKYSE